MIDSYITTWTEKNLSGLSLKNLKRGYLMDSKSVRIMPFAVLLEGYTIY